MLDGLRVVELTTEVGGALTGRLLALYGADVIVVEPKGGHAIRALAPRAGDAPDQSITFAYLGAGKRSVELDLGDSAAWSTVRSLIATADVLLDSLPPGELANHGLDPRALIEEFPQLVITSVTPFGQTGPRADWRDTDLIAAAAGGQMSMSGDADRPPLKTAGHQGHYQAGLHAFGGTLAAVFAARRSGHGDWLDISVQEVQVATLEGAGPAALIAGTDTGRAGNTALAQWGIHPTKDGWIGFASMPRQTPTVFELIGRPECNELPGFASGWSPEPNALLMDLIPAWTTQRTSKEIFEEAALHRTPVSMIPTPSELLEWPGLNEVGFWQWVDHPVLGKYPLPGGPIILSDGSRGEAKRAPLLGEHTADVLSSIDATPAKTALKDGATEPELPLAGLRVVDVTAVWAGPYATRFLADMGAEVIKVEGPSAADPVRTMTGARQAPEINQSAYFNEYSRNKLGISLDLKQPEGMEALRRLIATADVFIENWSSGVAERLGLGWEELKKLRPDIISVSMPGFGHRGSDASRIGFGPSIEQMGGLVALQGYEGEGPHRSGISYGDPVSGTIAAGAVMMALLHRQQTGEGSSLTIPQRDLICSLIGEFVAAQALGHPLPTQIGSRDVEFAPHNVYRTKDTPTRISMRGLMPTELNDAWLAVAVDSTEAWAGLKRVITDARLDAPNLGTAAGRRSQLQLLDTVIGEWAADKDADAAAAELQAQGVPASAVLTPLELTQDAHLLARGAYMPYSHPEHGEKRSTRPTWRMLRRPAEPLRGAPCFGEHTGDVLKRVAGYSDAELAEFERKNVITKDLIAGAAG